MRSELCPPVAIVSLRFFDQCMKKAVVRTASIACLTRGERIRPFLDRFSMRASFVAPEDLQAMLRLLRAGSEVWAPIFGLWEGCSDFRTYSRL